MRTEPLAVQRHLRDFDEQASPDTKPGTGGRGAPRRCFDILSRRKPHEEVPFSGTGSGDDHVSGHVSAGAKDFTDSTKIQYNEAVDVMSAVKVIDGYTDGSFNPSATLTRGAAAKIICNPDPWPHHRIRPGG